MLDARRAWGLVLSVSLLAAGCGGSDQQGARRQQPAPTELTVGSLEGLESQAVSQMYKQILEDADYQVDWVFDHATQSELFSALEAGEIDVAPFYPSSLVAEIGLEVPASGNAALLAGALDEVLRERSLRVLSPARANSGLGLAVTPDTADEFGLEAIEDLAGVASRMTVAAQPECQQDPGCLPGLEQAYGLEFRRFEATDDPAGALEREIADAAVVPATSADVRRERWVILEDGQEIQPAENLTPIARTEVVNDEIAGLLNAVGTSLDAGELTVYNGAMDLGEAPGVVASLHLQNERLLGLEDVGTGPVEAPLGDEPPEVCSDGTGSSVATVIADELAFDTGCLVVTGDQSIEFVNDDDAYPHSFTVSRDRTYSPPFLLDLDDGQGGQTVRSEPVGGKLGAGGWPFVCRYHEYMAGELWVVA